jgi:hypothetical protein
MLLFLCLKSETADRTGEILFRGGGRAADLLSTEMGDTCDPGERGLTPCPLLDTKLPGLPSHDVLGVVVKSLGELGLALDVAERDWLFAVLEAVDREREPGARLRSSKDDLRSPLAGVSRFAVGRLDKSREGLRGVSYGLAGARLESKEVLLVGVKTEDLAMESVREVPRVGEGGDDRAIRGSCWYGVASLWG